MFIKMQKYIINVEKNSRDQKSGSFLFYAAF